MNIVTACCCIHNFIHRLCNGVYDNITEFALDEWRAQQRNVDNLLFEEENEISYAEEGLFINKYL